jgi:hypothetical protein
MKLIKEVQYEPEGSVPEGTHAGGLDLSNNSTL